MLVFPPMVATNLFRFAHRSSVARRLTLAACVFSAACASEPAAPSAQQAMPDGDAQARWFGHVEALANDSMRGRETGSPEHLKAAEYVADHFKQAGLEPAGTAGYLQPVAFRSRRIDEAQSSLALVTKGKAVPVTLGDEATFGMRIDPAPSVEAPLVFAGHGLQIPELKHDDFAGLDVKGKVVVLLSGSPASVPRRAQRALPVGGGALEHAEATRRHRHDLAGQPEEHGRAVGALGAQPPQSRDGPRRPVARRHGRAAGLHRLQPRACRAAVRGLRPHLRGDPEDRRRGQGAPALPASHLGSRQGGRGEPGCRVAQRRGCRPRQRPEARGRVRRAHRAPGSRWRGRADQRGQHLQRRHGQRVRHRDADRIRRRSSPGRSRSARWCSSR